MNNRTFQQKRSRSRSPFSEHRNSTGRRDLRSRNFHGFARNDKKANQNDREAQEWVDKEDLFVLNQAKKKAQIRVREGRATPIDWLAVVSTTVVNPDKEILGDDVANEDIEIADPIEIVSELDEHDLHALEKDINHYLVLERHRDSRQFWKAMKLICGEKMSSSQPASSVSRSVGLVSKEVDSLLGQKSRQDLDRLEIQIKDKLKDNIDIDVEYWEHLLDSIKLYKAKSDLKKFYQDVLNIRMRKLEAAQLSEANLIRTRLRGHSAQPQTHMKLSYDRHFDPEPRLRIESADRWLQMTNEAEFLQAVTADHQRVQRKGYIPKIIKPASEYTSSGVSQTQLGGIDIQQGDIAAFDKAAQGIGEDEADFALEEKVQTTAKRKWEGEFHARKPKYVNRVQMGYEWNKYNQTHYDQDNPPPKVVQGYKFNIFYPDLIDKTKAPTYRIERENGRKRGQTFAPAGEEDTCIIRFMSGPPYEDVAFRIVDKEWDYSAKRERGFRSTYDRDMLQLHFQFKKVYYRK